MELYQTKESTTSRILAACINSITLRIWTVNLTNKVLQFGICRDIPCCNNTNCFTKANLLTGDQCKPITTTGSTSYSLKDGRRCNISALIFSEFNRCEESNSNRLQ